MPWLPAFPPLWPTSLTPPNNGSLQLSCPICSTLAGRSLFTSTSEGLRWNANASSILYKTKLPFILVFNKTDVQPHDFAVEWMQDFEAFQTALASHRDTSDEEGEPTYMNSLMNSMSLVLDEFYKNLKVSCYVALR
jgi:GTPase SAR1 family protein